MSNCGKLVALLVASDEVRVAFQRKYGGKISVIGGRDLDGCLAMVTTTSALGRSSLYNRVSFNHGPIYHRGGFTRGTGDFHFNNGIYQHLWSYAMHHCRPTAKQAKWGKGVRNRRETVRKCLTSLGLPMGWMTNLVQREIFIVPLAANCQDFLRGGDLPLDFYDRPMAALFQWFPHSSFDLASRTYSFMTIGPVSPLSFAGTPLFLNAFNDVKELLLANRL